MASFQPSQITCKSQGCPTDRLDGGHLMSSIDEPIDHQWLQRYYHSLPSPPNGEKRSIEDYQDAYLFGLRSRSQNKAPYASVCNLLEETWNDLIGPSVLEWADAEPIVHYVYSCGGIRHPKRLTLGRQTAAA